MASRVDWDVSHISSQLSVMDVFPAGVASASLPSSRGLNTLPRASHSGDYLQNVKRRTATVTMAEEIQQLILDTLDSQGKVKDTRTLVLPGQSDAAATQDAQTAILGALNSLSSREVRDLHSKTRTFRRCLYFTADGHNRVSRNAVPCVNPRRRTDRS